MLEEMADPNRIEYYIAPLIKRLAHTYRVETRWIWAIIKHESQLNAYAIRYEPDYPYLYKPDKFAGALNSIQTEVNSQKTSWGLGQVMGALAREQGLKGFMAQLIDPEINVTHVAIRLATLSHQSKDTDSIFAGYNGGIGAMRKLENGLFRNQSYVESVNKLIKV